MVILWIGFVRCILGFSVYEDVYVTLEVKTEFYSVVDNIFK